MTVEERVMNGAEWLDKKQPGWDNNIDLDILDIQSTCKCVCGQLGAIDGLGKNFPGYSPFKRYLDGHGFNLGWGTDWIYNHGFAYRSADGEQALRDLNDAWRTFIMGRLQNKVGEELATV